MITRSKGKLLLYVQMQKLMHGLLRRAIVFDRNPTKDLEAYGFQINSYEPCVENKMANDKHMTVVCHINDLDMSQLNIS